MFSQLLEYNTMTMLTYFYEDYIKSKSSSLNKEILSSAILK
jgi:hypothetical protein